jgi:hypothetical protein
MHLGGSNFFHFGHIHFLSLIFGMHSKQQSKNRFFFGEDLLVRKNSFFVSHIHGKKGWRLNVGLLKFHPKIQSFNQLFSVDFLQKFKVWLELFVGPLNGISIYCHQIQSFLCLKSEVARVNLVRIKFASAPVSTRIFIIFLTIFNSI